MKNIENWKTANRFSSIIMMRFSSMNIIVFFIISVFLENLNKNIFGIILVLEFIVLFYLTETKLKKNENN